MRKATSALFVVLLFLFGCTKESVSPETTSGDDYLKGAKVKIKTLKIHDSSGDMNVVPYDYCDNGLLIIEGTGHATLLGAFTVRNTTCYGSGDLINGVLHAANGDSICTIGWPTVKDGVPIYHYEIENGSGRFEGATGFIDMWGSILFNPNTGTGTFELEGLGQIEY